MKHLKTLLLGSVSVAVLALPVAAQDMAIENYEPVTDAELQNPDPSDWLMWRGTLNHQGYSPLDQITTDNVDDLQVAWSRTLPDGLLEGTPIVRDGVMFFQGPNDEVLALDATTGDTLWEYNRELPEEGLPGLIIARNLALWEDKVILQTKDNFMVALNAQTGQVEWETQIRGEENWGWATAGPIIANGKAISGRSCAQQGGPGDADSCFLAAHDLETGEELWRFQLIPREGTGEAETWGDVPRDVKHHVGSWITPSYDPELNMVYFGTSVTSPYSKFYFAEFEDVADLEDQEFLYQTSTLAIDADTGELVWYQQHIRDQWDLDHPFERILVDTAIAPNPDEVRWINPNVTPGEERRVLTGIPGKTGIFYAIDRETGEFLWARETVFQNVISDIDVETGRAEHPLDQIPTEVGQEFLICPPAIGGKDWQAGAYSPLTNAIYYPLQNLCMEPVTTDEDIQLGPYVLAPGEENVGTVRGISVETGEELWKWETRPAVMSLVATGGGLVFGGDVNRRFRAFDQETGDVLWEHIMPAQVGGYPVSYAVDGVQYIAVPVGSMLISGAYAGLTPELSAPSGGNTMVVFALPQ